MSNPSFPDCPLGPKNSTPHLETESLQFNPDLILLKPLRNAMALPYTHWGGTDHEELGDPHQRRGSGFSILRKTTAEASRPNDASCYQPILPATRHPLISPQRPASGGFSHLALVASSTLKRRHRHELSGLWLLRRRSKCALYGS